MAGRPMKWKTVEEIKEDGNVVLEDTNFHHTDFSNEKELVQYISNNIDDFTDKQLGDKVILFEIDKPIDKQRFGPRGRRIDIFIQGEKGVYIIECKNAKNSTEIRHSIGQLLDYGREYLDPKKELILIANMYDQNTAKTIKFYNLPIRYIILSKFNSLEYVGEA